MCLKPSRADQQAAVGDNNSPNDELGRFADRREPAGYRSNTNRPRLTAGFFPLFVLILPTLSWAGVGVVRSLHNDEIDRGVRNTIHDLNAQLIQSFRDNNPRFMHDLFLENIRDRGMAPVEDLYRQWSELITTHRFNPRHDYHVKFLGLGEHTFPVLSETTPQILMHLSMSNQGPKFISVLETQGHFQDYAMWIIYQRPKDEWRLNGFHLNIVRIANKTAMDWYAEAKHMHAKAHHLPAMLHLSVANQLLRPARFAQYEDEHKIRDLQTRCRSQLEEVPLPHEVQLPTRPQILGIRPQFAEGVLLPVFSYLSSTPLENESKLSIEAHEMMPEVIKLYPGIASYSDHILFRAFSEMPSDPNRQYTTYGVLVETNNFATQP